ncbi:MAG: hypothetical protein GQ564_22630 [Bacteroidales bacterium]|nr:hypothetical protein [Bacteroidales bacterium]
MNLILIEFLKDMNGITEIVWIVDLVLIISLLIISLLTFKNCYVRSLVNKFIYFFYAIGFVLFVLSYFLIRNAKNIKDDGTIAIAMFIVIVCLILVKRMKDSNARKEYP